MFTLRRLEERIVLDGAGVVDDMDHEVLVVDTILDDAADLAAAAQSDVIVVEYDSTESSMADVASMVESALNGQKADSIAIAAQMAQGTLENDAEAWADLGSMIEEGGRLDLLACNVAKDESGLGFVENMESLTGVDVAASDDATGNESNGGDWILETDGIDAASIYFDVDALGEFDALLLPPDYANPMAPQSTPQETAMTYTIPGAFTNQAGVSAWIDPEGATLSYYIQSGRPAWLAWNPATATFSGTPTAQSAVGVYQINMIAFDGAEYDIQPLEVTVSNTNDPPVYNDTTLSIVEGAALGDVVGTAAASDPDVPTYDSLTYSIIGGTGQTAFDIDNTGQITVADPAQIDADTTPSFTLLVNATDESGLSDGATVTINVTDINEQPVYNDETLSIVENSTVGSVVGTAAATDPDGDALTYQILSGNTDGAFAIDINGQITVANSAPLDYEALAPSYAFTLQVEATDPGGLSDTATVTIDIQDGNDAPVFGNTGPFTVPENSLNGTTVGNLNVTDPEGNTITYNITGGDPGGVFTVDASGNLVVADNTGLNYETSSTFNLTIDATDNGTNPGPLTTTETVTVNLTDENDAPTGILLDNATIQEGTYTVDTAVGILTAVDEDAGDSHVFQVSSFPSKFTVQGNQLMVKAGETLDFPNNETVEVLVQDSGGDQAFETFTITVTDVNEPPEFTATGPFDIPENSPNTTSVGLVSATDPEGDAITFSISGGTGAAVFSINSSTGQIRVADSAQLDFEATTSYTLDVQATDASLLSSTATVTIDVNDVNEQPVFGTFGPFSVAEGSTAGATVGTPVTATDPDQGDTLTYSIAAATNVPDVDGDTNLPFTIDPVTGQIEVNDPDDIDFENKASYALTVLAEDTGGLQASTSVTVNVTNENDPPVLDDVLTSIDENSSAGTGVATLAANDPDLPGDTLTYTITGGNDDPDGDGTSAFALDSTSGALTVADADDLDYETTTQFVLTVEVEDSGLLTDTATVTIDLNDVNDAPVIDDGQVLSVAENSAFGTSVGTVTAQDSDVPPNDFVYTIISGNDGNAFSISSFTGEISVQTASMLDHETNPTFTLEIQIEEVGVTPALSDTAFVTVNVTDENEAPVFDPNTATFSIPENAADGIQVGQVAASDPEGDSITYYTLDGGPEFAVDGSGIITVPDTTLLDFETKDTYTFTVFGEDSGPLSGTIDVTVNLTDANDPPVFLVTPGPFTVDENAANTTTVGTPLNDPAVVEDPDGDTLTFTITGGTGSGIFGINGTTGQIEVANGTALDYETESSYTVDVEVSDGLGGTATETITIDLNDLNETPFFSTTYGPFSISEGAALGDPVGSPVVAEDLDAGANGNLTYSILDAGNAPDQDGDTNLPFAIDPTTGQIEVNDPDDIDYDTTTTYTITVQAEDDPGLTATTDVTINVTDVNEPPTDVGFAPDPANITTANVDENIDTTGGYMVGTLQAVDEDATGTYVYTIVTGVGDAALFSISGDSLMLDDGVLNFEGNPTYTVDVKVWEGANQATTTLTVDVNDLPEAPTDITFNPDPPTVADGVDTSAASVWVADLGNVDDDAPAVGYEYSILLGGDSQFFTIANGTELHVKQGVTVDFETQDTYTFDVRVKETGTTLSYTETVSVQVTDTNEQPVLDDATFNVDENSLDPTYVGTLTATDPDTADTLTYSVTGGTGDTLFDVDPATGDITVAVGAVLDYEAQTSYTLNVEVADDGAPVLTDTAVVTIDLNDVNDPPSFDDAPSWTDSVLESAQNGDVVYAPTVTDQDQPADTLTYSITGGTGVGVFSINSGTGEILVADASQLDAETFPYSYTLELEVSDGQATGALSVTIDVANANDAPVFTNVGPYSVVESTNDPASTTALGDVVGTLAATDQDPLDTLTYSILTNIDPDGNGTNAFDIVGADITVNDLADLNYESNASLQIEVEVTDGAGGSATSFVTINLEDFNDSPVIDEVIDLTTAGTFTIPEDSPDGTQVADVDASDEDGDALTYSLAITAGTPDGDGDGTEAFTIDANTGLITVADGGDLDYETDTSYDLEVTVSDGTTTVDTVVVTITDVNDAPEFTFTGPFTLDEAVVGGATGVGTSVGTVTATDADLPAQTVTFSIVSNVDPNGNGTNAFDITAGGEITVADADDVNYELNNSLTITVQADDGTGAPNATTTADVVIDLNDLNDPPVFDQVDYTFEISENGPLGASVGFVTATDEDSPAQTLLYSITAGNQDYDVDGTLAFKINQATGEITVNDPGDLDYESSPNFFDLTVTATDDGVPVASTDVDVHIDLLDDNDAPTAIALDNTDVTELDNDTMAPAPITVGTLTSTDVDAGDTFTYTVTGGADAALFQITGDQLEFVTGTMLDFEGVYSATSFEVEITTTDSGGASFTEAPFTINLVDANDTPTEVQFASTTTPEIDVPENNDDTTDTLIGQLQTVDQDAADTFTYNLIGGPDYTDFYVDATGQLLANTGVLFDFEGQTTYSMDVRVIDSAGAFYDETLTLTVEDSNDTPVLNTPIDDQTAEEGQMFMLSLPVDTFTDPDGDPITYDFAGTLPAWLTFDPDTLTFMGVPETLPDPGDEGTYTIEMTAYDVDPIDPLNEGDTMTFDIVVSPTNLAPDIVDDSAVIPENTAAGDLVYTVDGNDPNATDTITYTITGGTGSGVFEINSTNGEVTVAAGATLDFEAGPKMYDLQIEASDGDLTDTATLTVFITNVDENPEVTNEIPDQTVSLGAGGFWSFTFDETAFSDPEGSDLTYTATGMDAWLSFSPSTRTFFGIPTGTVGDSFTVTVEASDGAANVIQDSFEVHYLAQLDAEILDALQYLDGEGDQADEALPAEGDTVEVQEVMMVAQQTAPAEDAVADPVLTEALALLEEDAGPVVFDEEAAVAEPMRREAAAFAAV